MTLLFPAISVMLNPGDPWDVEFPVVPRDPRNPRDPKDQRGLKSYYPADSREHSDVKVPGTEGPQG